MRTRGRVLTAVLLVIGMAAGAEAQRATPERVAVARGWLGVVFHTPSDAEVAVLDDVMRDSPAGRAGLQPGDTVTLWNGRRDVSTAIRERPLEPGDTVRIRVRRGERDLSLAIVAGSRPATMVYTGRGADGEELFVIRPGDIERRMRLFSDSLRQRLEPFLRDSLREGFFGLGREELALIEERMREMERTLPRLSGDRLVLELGTRSVAGAEFAEMNEGLSSYFGTDEGVVVLKVAEGTPAARAGLRAGDVVVRVNDQGISAIDELRRAVARAQTRAPRTVTLQVIRRGERRDLQMRGE